MTLNDGCVTSIQSYLFSKLFVTYNTYQSHPELQRKKYTHKNSHEQTYNVQFDCVILHWYEGTAHPADTDLDAGLPQGLQDVACWATVAMQGSQSLP